MSQSGFSRLTGAGPKEECRSILYPSAAGFGLLRILRNKPIVIHLADALGAGRSLAPEKVDPGQAVGFMSP